MANVNTDEYKLSPLAEIKSQLNDCRYDPTLLIKKQLEVIESATNGDAVMMDPTHPAVVLLEMGACMASNNLQETIGLLRRQYPALADVDTDLYLHMSDDDYLNRFASASTAKLTFGMLYSDIQTKLVYDKTEKAYKAIIPRDSRFTVDGVTFTLMYPVVIRRYETGAIQVAYDSSISSPLQELRGIVLTPSFRKSPKQDQWMFFTVDVVQVDYTSNLFALDKVYLFRKEIDFADQFYFARVYYSNANTNNTWLEMKTTHTDLVFDSNIPTALLKVLNGVLQVEIPIIYFTKGYMTGQLRVDIFTTKGALTMNLRSYGEDAYTVNLTPLDKVRDTNEYTLALADISYYVYGTEASVGGKRELTFEELRSRVIYNAVGPQVLPITNVQNVSSAQNYGFDIVKNVDVLTNRKFLATRKLPTPSNAKLITPANIGIVTYAELLSTILENENVISHGNRHTIRSNTLYANNNGVVRMLRKHEEDALYAMGRTAMVAHINSHEYFYSPFYYVLDETQSEFDLRGYMLDQPYAYDLSFERQNQTAQLFVNTGKYSVEKIDLGYRLTIQTNSGTYYKEMADSLVGVQLAFKPYGESTYAYINGTQIGRTAEAERIYKFDIVTEHECDSNDLLAVLNAQIAGITNYKAWVDLETEFELIHYTGDIPSTFIPDATNTILGRFLLEPFMVGNSLEKIKIHFGDALINLWRRNHSYELDTVYQTYMTDIPLRYESDVYDAHSDGTIFDLVNGEVVYRYLHRKDDPVLDADGNQVYKHRVGEVILDEQGEPIKTSQASTGREIDILVIDGRYYFADDAATVEYRDEIASTLTSWITGDIAKIQENLLEQTDIYFYPKTTLGNIKILIENNNQDYITAEQTFTVTLYVKFSIYNDSVIRSTLENATISLLDNYISQPTINMTEVRDQLKSIYGDSVSAFKLSGLGGEKDYEIVSMASDKNKLCLKKVLTIQPDMSMFVKDAVEFDFKLVN